MPSWGEILAELNALQKDLKERKGNPKTAFDTVRRKYLASLQKLTGRNVVLYATNWTSPGGPPPELVSITDEDIHALMEVLRGLSGDGVDIILHSPGGSAESAEALVSYLRTKFQDIRVVVPQAAMSAATMLACAANRIVMGKHSFLGPIDPQLILATPVGTKAVPAQAILDQFRKAQEECKDPQLLASWLPMLSQYGPALLIECENALSLAQELVSRWLKQYMFQGDREAEQKSRSIAAALADHKTFRSHSRHLSRDQVKSLGGYGLVVDDLEASQEFQDAVLSIFHAAIHTFGGTGAAKIVENHLGRAYVKVVQMIVVEERTPQATPEEKRPES